MKEYLEGVIARCDATLAELREKNEKAQSVEELRSITERIESVMTERGAAQEALAGQMNIEPEERGGFNPVATYGDLQSVKRTEGAEDVRSSMEYRTAFMNFVQKGTMSDILMRADAQGVTEDLGILLPNTIVQRIMLDVEKVYGQIYSKVRKTNVKGGVQYPIGEFTDLKVYWNGIDGTDKENGVSEYQSTGKVNGFISFNYHIGEVRIAQSLLMSILTVQAFEDEVVKTFLSTFVRTMDEVILNGDGVNQPEGIITEMNKGESRIPKSNIIELTEADMADWKQWQKKLFAKIPLSMRKLRPEFIMTAETFESNIMTLVDENNRPLARETYNATTGDEKATFKAREVTFVEEGAIKSFDSAASGDVIALYWVPDQAYLINFNQQFSYVEWVDHETNKKKKKGLFVADGKVLDPKYIWIVKKK